MNNDEPDWLRAQREESRKSRNMAASSGVVLIAAYVVLSPLYAIPRTATGLLIAAVYFLILAIAFFVVARKFSARGSLLRYSMIALIIISGSMSVITAAVAPTY